MRRHSFSQPIKRLTMLRRRYVCRSNSTKRASPSSFVLLGMMGTTPVSTRYSSIHSARYPLSPARKMGVMISSDSSPRTSHVSRSSCKQLDSWAWPGESTACSGWPCESHSRWILVLKPPRLRPKASQLASSSARFHGSNSTSRGSNGRAINTPQLVVDRSCIHVNRTQQIQDFIKRSVLIPRCEHVVDRTPLTEFLRQVTPRSPGPHDPQNAINHHPSIDSWPACASRRRKEASNQFPLIIGKTMACHDGPPCVEMRKCSSTVGDHGLKVKLPFSDRA